MRTRHLVLLGFLAGNIAWARPAYELYGDGIAALKRKDCQAAISSLKKAIKKDSKETPKKRTYGMASTPYYPHLQLAKAFACAGDREKALAELAISERQGAYEGSEIRSLRASLTPPTPEPTAPRPTPSKPPPTRTATEDLSAGKAALKRGDTAAARTWFKRALAKDQTNREAKRLLQRLDQEEKVASLLSRARRAFQGTETDSAKPLLAEVLRLDPGNREALLLKRRLDEASAPPEPAPTKSPKEMAADLLLRAKKAQAAGRLDEASDLLRQASRLIPGDLTVVRRLAKVERLRTEARQRAESRQAIDEAKRLMRAGDLNRAKVLAAKAASLDLAGGEARALLTAIEAKLRAKHREPVPSPDEAVHQKLKLGVKAYFEGRYDDAIAYLSGIQATGRAAALTQVYLGAAYYSRYLLEGEQDRNLLASATSAFRRSRGIDAGVAPDPALFPPAIVDAWKNAL